MRANLVIAFPNEGHKQVWETINYGIELAQIGIQNIIFLRYTPYPGSAYFKLCQERGQIPPFGPEFDNFLMTTVSGELTSVKSYNPTNYWESRQDLPNIGHIANSGLFHAIFPF